MYDADLFDCQMQLPSDLEITWNKRLTKTAGQTVSTRLVTLCCSGFHECLSSVKTI